MEWRVRGGDSSCCILRVKRAKEDGSGCTKKRRPSTDGDGDFGGGCATESQTRDERREVRPSGSGGEGRTAHACSGSIDPAGPNNSRSLILLREHRPSPFRAPSGVEGASNGQKCLEVQIRWLRY